MEAEKSLFILHLFVAFLLILLILVQSRGVGLSAAFGGGGEVFRTKRGVERIVFILTIVMAFLFVVSSIINVRSF